MVSSYDFSGYATRNNLRCSDGRTIRKDAFKECDGKKVPLVWNHQHDSSSHVLGHAILENRDDGVYAYCSFNDTEKGQDAKLLVEHGDIDKLSIYANRLKQRRGDVLHGVIREVSLVFAGANPGAYIDSIMQHDEASEEEAVIYTGEYILVHGEDDEDDDFEADRSDEVTNNLEHADDSEPPEEIFKSLNEDQKKLFYILAGYAGSTLAKHDDGDHSEEGNVTDDVHHSESEAADAKNLRSIFSTLNEKQKKLLYGLVGSIDNDSAEHSDDSEAIEHSDDENYEGENTEMKTNAFDKTNTEQEQPDVLTHAEEMAIIQDASRYGSMKESALQHGVTELEYLFPDFKEVGSAAPKFVNNDVKWVASVMNKVHHTPFSRIKSTFADITPDEARAKGYVKGAKKTEEVFGLLKRTTDPQTIYKKQSLDRDDIADITSFDVVSWLKGEMRMKLNEEIARAILLGDGRSTMHADKIKEDKIRPIWTDDDLYCVHHTLDGITVDSTEEEKAHAFIDGVVYAMENYEGSGNPDLFIDKHMLSVCLLLKDKNGIRLYKDKNELAAAMMVDSIIPVPQLGTKTRKDEHQNTFTLQGIVVDLRDYTVGADKGGSVSMFEDFDIDYNKEKYLIETRCSGALTVPHSALSLEIKTPAAA